MAPHEQTKQCEFDIGNSKEVVEDEQDLLQISSTETSMHCKKKSRSAFRLSSFLPILDWLPKYDVRTNLFNDFIGGVTVGIMHVPQGMAYSSLAGLKPVHGLYTSLFPALIYMIFGTSRHVSLGVFAVVSLMVGSCNLRVTQMLVEQSNNSTSVDLSDYVDVSVSVVTSLSLLVGFIQIGMGILRLDFFISYLSDQIIGGFTTGAAFIVFTAQLNKILGVSLPRHSGPGKLFWIYQDLINSIIKKEMNYTTIIISIVTIILLYSLKNYFDPLVKKKCKLPIPYDLFVIITGTIVSHVFHLNTSYGVKVIGHIPTGLPLPTVPDISLFPYFISDALAIAVVSLVVTVSMGKLFAKKHHYEIDVRQEFYALGIIETTCSFLPCWPSSTALARTLVYEAAGTKTQLATVFSSILLLLVIFFIGPLIESLPTCFLSCIIIVALKGMFMQLKTIPVLWKASRIDAAIFVISLLATVIFDVVFGLLIGVATALLFVIMRLQRQKISVGEKTKTGGEEGLLDVDLTIHFDVPLLYINAEKFKKHVEEAVQTRFSDRIESDKCDDKSVEANCVSEQKTKNRKALVVVDMSKVAHIDYTGANSLAQIHDELLRQRIEFKVRNLSETVEKFLHKFADKRINIL